MKVDQRQTQNPTYRTKMQTENVGLENGSVVLSWAEVECEYVALGT
jgi:hypothetical protein